MLTDHDILEVITAAVLAGKEVRIAVAGRSMGPAFESVCEILVRPPIPSKLRVGNIVVVQRNGHWVVHRIMWKRAGRFITKGDGLGQLDRPRVIIADIKGLVVGLGLKNGTMVDLCSFPAHFKGLMLVLRGWLNLLFTQS